MFNPVASGDGVFSYPQVVVIDNGEALQNNGDMWEAVDRSGDKSLILWITNLCF